MGILDLISNTVEGVGEAALSTVKAVAGVVVAPIDGGETISEGVAGVVTGIRKIGDTKPQGNKP